MGIPSLPERFESVDALEDFMSVPSAALTADLERAPGDILILGVGGKMGPTLARMAKRAAPGRRAIGVRPSAPAACRDVLHCVARDKSAAIPARARHHRPAMPPPAA